MFTATLTKSSTGAWMSEDGDLVDDLAEYLDVLPEGATLELSAPDEDELATVEDVHARGAPASRRAAPAPRRRPRFRGA